MSKRNAQQVIDELGNYLPALNTRVLQMDTAVKGSILICMNITDIVHSYNSTQENEDMVCHLLSELCNIHFSKVEPLKKRKNRT